ncbi:hypothetical protein N7478_010805 [Penicillium angulare]|uniref:uncharacterized protein n=1 Tax=Penicillium angulare TaxID=116970 RepID=UPI002541336A|nr:uncharacterized protein N7478_010805 [Penicillium angulare]KAJ5263200.1 hypothetical protein N7478_010805 [Penicillium angulare]
MASNDGSPSSGLYPGEILDTIAGFPTIYHYQPALNPTIEKPLIVCVTGGLHLARIFYGGHDGYNPKDFLSHRLAELGFGVLSLSYPTETTPPIMPLTGAAFRLYDWGLQAAETVKRVIERNGLSRSVVLISWSMGGRMVVPFNMSAKERGITVEQYIGFAATPGISRIRPLPPGMVCSSVGYFHVPSHTGAFYQQLKEMAEYTGHEIIPREIYLREYIGGTPINLVGMGLKYDGRSSFIRDEVPHEQDSQVFNISNLPLISSIYPTSILDARHALSDKATWGFLLTYAIEVRLSGTALLKTQDQPKWQSLMNLVHEAPNRLSAPVGGNHFFFAGEKGAQETADQIERLLQERKSIENEISDLGS